MQNSSLLFPVNSKNFGCKCFKCEVSNIKNIYIIIARFSIYETVNKFGRKLISEYRCVINFEFVNYKNAYCSFIIVISWQDGQVFYVVIVLHMIGNFFVLIFFMFFISLFILFILFEIRVGKGVSDFIVMLESCNKTNWLL